MQIATASTWKQDILPLFTGRMKDILESISENAPLEEIRIRAGQPLQLVFATYERLIYAPGGRPVANEADCAALLERMCEHSIYAWEEELKSGFLTLAGGYRVGLCGRAVMEQGSLHHFTDITSFNIRISRACEGAATKLLPWIVKKQTQVYATLLFSPPGCGKTTLLRDMARLLSSGVATVPPCRVCVVDERMELAGSVRGISQYNLGPRTDVLSGYPKVQGMQMVLRVLAPDILITDEIGTQKEAEAVLDAANAGVVVLASVHGSDISTLLRRSAISNLITSGTFERLVLLGRTNHVGSIESIWDGSLQQLYKGEVACSKPS